MDTKVKTNFGNCVIAFHHSDMRLTFIDMQNYAITIDNNNVDLKNFVLTSGSNVITIFDTKEFKKMYLKNQELVKIRLGKEIVKQVAYKEKIRLEKIANEKQLKKDTVKKENQKQYLYLKNRRVELENRRKQIIKNKINITKQEIFKAKRKAINIEIAKKRALEITNAKHKVDLRIKNLLVVASKKAFWDLYCEIKDFSTKADLSKLISTQNKSFNMKKKEFVNVVCDFRKLYLAKIKNRKALKNVPIITKKDFKKIWLGTVLYKIQSAIVENYGHPNSGLNLDYGDKFTSFVNEKISWEKYQNNSNYGYPEKFHTWCIDIPKPKTKKMLHDICYDGIINIDILNRRKIGNIEILKAVWLKKNRGYNVGIQTGYIAINGDVSYHSIDSIKKAVKGLQNKIKRMNIPKKVLCLQTKMSRTLFAKLTGACKVGIKDFCNNHNLQAVRFMTIENLLPILPSNYANILKSKINL